MKLITRFLPEKNLYTPTGSVNEEGFLKRHDIIHIIRLDEREFEEAKTMKTITHFNLQTAEHAPDRRYGLVKIVKHGWYDGNKEQPPLLDLDTIIIVKGVDYKEISSYALLQKEDFKDSFSHIKTKDALKESILKRYMRSLPHLTKEEILSLGVAKTTLLV